MRKQMITAGIILAGFAAVMAAGAALTTRFAYASTPSISVGWYAVEALHSARRGDVVRFCPPLGLPHLRVGVTPCASGYTPLIKRVAAAEGDHVRVTDYGVYVNGSRLKGSMPLHVGRGGFALPQWRGEITLTANELWVYGYHPQSFDSRYFGPVERDQHGVHWIERATAMGADAPRSGK